MNIEFQNYYASCCWWCMFCIIFWCLKITLLNNFLVLQYWGFSFFCVQNDKLQKCAYWLCCVFLFTYDNSKSEFIFGSTAKIYWHISCWKPDKTLYMKTYMHFCISSVTCYQNKKHFRQKLWKHILGHRHFFWKLYSV